MLHPELRSTAAPKHVAHAHSRISPKVIFAERSWAAPKLLHRALWALNIFRHQGTNANRDTNVNTQINI